MANDLSPVWEPLELSPYQHSDNLPEPNGISLSAEQKEQLNKEIIKLRKEQLKYLSSHPEIRGIIREFMQQILTQMPSSELIPKFCRNFFGQCKYELQLKIEKHVNDLLGTNRKPPEDIVKLLDYDNSYNDSSWYWSPDSSDNEIIS